MFINALAADLVDEEADESLAAHFLVDLLDKLFPHGNQIAGNLNGKALIQMNKIIEKERKKIADLLSWLHWLINCL